MSKKKKKWVYLWLENAFTRDTWQRWQHKRCRQNQETDETILKTIEQRNRDNKQLGHKPLNLVLSSAKYIRCISLNSLIWKVQDEPWWKFAKKRKRKDTCVHKKKQTFVPVSLKDSQHITLKILDYNNYYNTSIAFTMNRMKTTGFVCHNKTQCCWSTDTLNVEDSC